VLSALNGEGEDDDMRGLSHGAPKAYEIVGDQGSVTLTRVGLVGVALG
jgi:hypothetical protein